MRVAHMTPRRHCTRAAASVSQAKVIKNPQ